MAARSRKQGQGEERRIQAVKDAHADGHYAARNAALSTRMAQTNRANWRNPEWVDRFLGSFKRSINGFESRVLRFLRDSGLPLRFTGDRSLWVHCATGARRNPDFVHSDGATKKAILAHGTYWHRDEAECRQELADYESAGWSCFIVWEHEALDDILATSLRGFIS